MAAALRRNADEEFELNALLPSDEDADAAGPVDDDDDDDDEAPCVGDLESY